ncbi:MAG: sulfatase-like hydrolase/transferase [Dehalococcoidia bacterium]
MKQRLEATFKGPVVFYPLLLAAFPILFLYAYNISQTSASQVWLPLAISVAAALILWAILSVILRSLAKAGLATAIFLIFFFSYGRLYDALESWGAFVPQHAYLLPGMLFIWGYCVYFISLAKRDFRVTTKILNVMAVALIAINLFNIASYEIRLARLSGVTPGNSTGQTASNSTKPNALPDIYFIILDDYAHPDIMKEYYDYDDSQFINSLKDKGFFIASQSKTPSGATQLAIAQRLNMEYLQYEPSSDDTYRALAYSKVAEFLKTQGYQYIYFGTCEDVGTWDSYMADSADLYFNYYEEAATRLVSEFQKVLWSTTMLKPFYYHLVGTQYEIAYRRQISYTLEHLKTLPELKGPKFVAAHIYCPHSPFVFGPSGEYVPAKDWYNAGDKQFYLGQYIFISTEIGKVIDELLQKSEIPPIIIVQSDHGLRTCDSPYVGDEDWRKILNAMYLPGMDYNTVSDNISPVNTFRLIFDHYFGADYPLLPND